MYNEGALGVLFHLKISFALETHLAGVAIEAVRELQAALGIHPHLGTVGERQVIILSTGYRQCHQLGWLNRLARSIKSHLLLNVPCTAVGGSDCDLINTVGNIYGK